MVVGACRARWPRVTQIRDLLPKLYKKWAAEKGESRKQVKQRAYEDIRAAYLVEIPMEAAAYAAEEEVQALVHLGVNWRPVVEANKHLIAKTKDLTWIPTDAGVHLMPVGRKEPTADLTSLVGMEELLTVSVDPDVTLEQVREFATTGLPARWPRRCWWTCPGRTSTTDWMRRMRYLSRKRSWSSSGGPLILPPSALASRFVQSDLVLPMTGLYETAFPGTAVKYGFFADGDYSELTPHELLPGDDLGVFYVRGGYQAAQLPEAYGGTGSALGDVLIWPKWFSLGDPELGAGDVDTAKLQVHVFAPSRQVPPVVQWEIDRILRDVPPDAYQITAMTHRSRSRQSPAARPPPSRSHRWRRTPRPATRKRRRGPCSALARRRRAATLSRSRP